MKVLFLSFLINFNAFYLALTAQVLNPSAPPELLFSTNLNPPQYNLFITAQSSSQANFFKFTSPTPKFPSIVSIIDMLPDNRNVVLTYQNLYTQDQATEDGLDLTTCVNQTQFNCTEDRLTYPICNLLAPMSSDDRILSLTLNDVDCTSNTSAEPLCQLSWNNQTLLDASNNTMLNSTDLLCPEAVIDIVITLPVLKTQINSINLAGTGTVTFHYYSTEPVTNGTWMISGSLDRLYESSDVTSNSLVPLTDSDLDTADSYETIIKTKLLRHDYPQDIYCRYKLTYTGFIRGIYVNEYPSGVHAPRGTNLYSESTVDSTIVLPLRANQLNFVSIFGYNITRTDLQFITCRNSWAGSIVQVNFESYLYGAEVHASEDYTVQVATGSCSSGCLRCINANLCVKCSQYINMFKCQTFCGNVLMEPDYKGICNSVFEAGAALTEIVPADSSLQFYNDVKNQSAYVIAILAMTQPIRTFQNDFWYFGDQVLPESVYTYFPELSPGINNISGAELGMSFPDQAGTVLARYYPLNDSQSTLLGLYWSPPPDNTYDSKLDIYSRLTIQNEQYLYLNRLYGEYYTFDAWVNCPTGCQLQVECNGRVQLYKNEKLLLFDGQFITKWTYIYPNNITGFASLSYIVMDSIYFKPSVIGENVTFYTLRDPFLEHNITLTGSTPFAINIPNCTNQHKSLCLTCQQSFFLSYDKSSCVQSCGAGYYASVFEGVCKSVCSENEAPTSSGDKCVPLCNKAGYFYNETKGCQICVSGCEICLNENTCSQCRFDGPTNNATYCTGKSGTLYTNPDFNTNQTVILQQDEDTDVALLVADKSYWEDQMIYFYQDSSAVRQTPILKVLKMDRDLSSSLANTTIPPLSIAQSTPISVHYLRIQKDTTATNFSISGFQAQYYIDWPLNETLPRVDSTIGTLGTSDYNSPNALPQTFDKYTTVIATRLYQHNIASPINCQLQIKIAGNLRGIYANGELLIFDSTTDINTQRTIVSKNFTLEADYMTLLTIVGYNFAFSNLKFVNCTKTSSEGVVEQVTPILDSYLISDIEAMSDTFSVTNNTYCAPNCLHCRDSSYCLRCSLNFYLENGKCYTKCQNSNAFQLANGFCDTQPRQQGFTDKALYADFTPPLINVGQYVPLGIENLQVLSICTPFKVYPTSHAAYVLNSSDSPSLSEGSYQIKSLPSDDYYIYSNQYTNSQAASAGTNMDLILYTARQNCVLMYYYSSMPTTLSQMQTANDFQYIPLPNTTLSLDASKIYFLDFFIFCVGTCQITFQMEGSINMVLNERTYLYKGYIESYIGPITLSRTLTGNNHLVIQLWDTESFQLSIPGTYKVYAQGDFIKQDHLGLMPQQLCTVQNCLNCYKAQCVSCIDGYALNSAGQCVQICANTTTMIFERMCSAFNSTCSTSPTELLVLRDQDCVWNCLDDPGFYYNISSGCTGVCDITCKQCSGPSDNNCLSCNFPRLLTTNFTCVCAVGTQANSMGGCDSISSITFQNNSYDTTCSNVSINATLLPGELETYHPIFIWEVVSNADFLSQANLEKFLALQYSNTLSIPRSYFQPNKVYSFTAYYFNVMNLKIQNWITIQATINTIPSFTLIGGYSQTWRSYVSNSLQIQLGELNCLTSALNVTWTVISGPLLNSNLLYLPDYPLQAFLPACTAPFNDNIILKQRIQSIANPSIYQDRTITITTAPETFTALILTSNRDQPDYIDLSLSGIISYYDSCTNRQSGSISYLWLCTKTTAGGTVGDCPDANALFSTQRNTGDLTVPVSYFASGDVLEFTLFVQKNGIIKNATVIITVKAESTLLADLSFPPNCRKYTASQDCIVSALVSRAINNANIINLTRADFQSFTFVWQTIPTVPFAFFLDTMKLLSNQLQIPSDINSLLVKLNITSGLSTAFSYFSLPINRPPSGGDLVIAPNTGTSLVTNFTISANNWQDDDLPLAYQFYYSFIINDTTASLLYPESGQPQIYTLLPSHSTGPPVYIQVTITDFLGAQNQTQTQVQVVPENKTIAEKLQEYNSLIASVNQSDPIQGSVLLGIVTTAMSQLENEISSSVSANPCPTCSNHGSCPANQCICVAGWDLADCSVTSATVSSIVQTKTDNLQQLLDSYHQIQQEIAQNPGSQDILEAREEYIKGLIYQQLEEMTENPYFNTDDSMLLVEKILEQTLQATNSTLSVPAEVTSLSQIVSNMMSYYTIKSCKEATAFQKDLASHIIGYIDAISQSVLADKIASEEPTVITTDNMDLYFEKLSLCDLQNKTISVASDVPTITVNIDSVTTLNCTSEVNLEYYGFNQNILNCNTNNSANGTKDIIGIRITNATTGLPLDINITITLHPLMQCPSVCHRFGDDSCSCSNISPFDVKDQVIKLFALSNVANIFKVETLLQFQFWKSVSFWGVLFFSVWFLVSLYIVKKVLPHYDVINRFTLKPNKSKIKYFWASLMATHPLLSVYCLYRKEFSKRSRAILYFMRNLLFLALTSAINEVSSDTTFSYQISFSFDPYLVTLPFFIVMPICAIITWLIRTPNREDMQHKPKFMVTLIKTKDFVGIFLTAALFLISLLVIFVINANQNNAQQLMWTVNFITSVAQDLLLNPLIYLAFQHFAFKLHQSERCAKKPRLQKLVFQLLDPKLIELRAAGSTTVTTLLSQSSIPRQYSSKVAPSDITMKKINSDEKADNLSDACPSDVEKILKPSSHFKNFQEQKLSKLAIKSPRAANPDASFGDSSKNMLSDNKTIFKFKEESKSEKSEKGIAQGSTLSGFEASPLKLEDLALLKGTSSKYNRYLDSEPNSSQIKFASTIQNVEAEKSQSPPQKRNIRLNVNLEEMTDQIFLDLKSTPRTRRSNLLKFDGTPRSTRSNLIQMETPDVEKDLLFLRKENGLTSPSSERNMVNPSSSEYCFETLVDTPAGASTKRRRDLLRKLGNADSRRSTASLAENSFTDYIQNQAGAGDSVLLDSPTKPRESKKALSSFGLQRINSSKKISGISQSKVSVQESESSMLSIDLDEEAKQKGNTNNKLETLKEVNEVGTISHIHPRKESEQKD